MASRSETVPEDLINLSCMNVPGYEQALEIDAWGSMQMNASQFVDLKH